MEREDTTPAFPREVLGLPRLRNSWNQGGSWAARGGAQGCPAMLQASLPLGCRELRPVMGLPCRGLARMPAGVQSRIVPSGRRSRTPRRAWHQSVAAPAGSMCGPAEPPPPGDLRISLRTAASALGISRTSTSPHCQSGCPDAGLGNHNHRRYAHSWPQDLAPRP